MQAFCNIRKRRQVHVNRKWADGCEQTQDKDEVKSISSVIIHILSKAQMYFINRSVSNKYQTINCVFEQIVSHAKLVATISP
jgi:hypothetical protein